ncbi:MAG: ROK family protein [Clostridia bacterium]|nr:ROK family protein [Clostridia bacterium]
MRIAGIDIGGTSVKMGVFDTSAGLLSIERLPTRGAPAEQIVAGIAEFVNRSSVEMVGVGTAGYVDTQKGLITAENLKWVEVPLRSMLAEATGKRVWVDNDANAALMAEYFDGACRGVQTAVQITLGTGVGGALIMNGKPWRGHRNTACEFGHIITHIDGLQCPCSHKGCYEMYASAGALMRYTGTQSIVEVREGLEAGDPKIEEGFKVYIHELGVGMVSLIMTFNPEVFVIGGGLVSAFGDRLLNAVREEVYGEFKQRPDLFSGDICLAKHGNDAGMIGAAMLALEMGTKI